MNSLAVTGAIETASQVSAGMKAALNTIGAVAGNATSLVDVAAVCNVEPITMVDADVAHLPELGDVLQSLHSLFSGYYLQAVNMMNTIGGISVASKLAPLNPNRRNLGFEEIHLEGKHSISLESYRFKLPTMEDSKEDKPKAAPKEEMLDNDNVALIKEAANLSIGKIFNVTLAQENVKATIPIAIRLMVNLIPSRMMVELFTYRDGFDMDMKERYHAWRSGRLEFVKDLILCNDLIDKRRRAAIRDTNGILEAINNRESRNIAASFASGRASVATASNLAVLSKETLEEIQLTINGDLSHIKTRKAIFDNTNLMILAVVDKGWEMVTFYHRGIDAASTVSFRGLKTSAKGNGMDVGDILKAYVSGSAPTI